MLGLSSILRHGLALLLLLSSTGVLASPAPSDTRLETTLAEILDRSPLSAQQQYEMTRQGLAESIELHSALLRSGALSPRGWVLDCAGLRRQARAWLDRTDTLTGVFLGASLLEHWSVSCRSRMQAIWARTDLRRIESATVRAAGAFPPTWPPVSGAYTRIHVRDYLEQVNRESGLLVENRPCSRRTRRTAHRKGWNLARTAFEATQCDQAPAHGMLTDPDLAERLEGVPMATTLATSFLGLDQWVLGPDTMARALQAPEAMEKLVMEMTSLAPVPLILQEREGWFAHVPEEDRRQSEALGHVRRLAQVLTPVLSQWPEPQQCQRAGDEVRQSLQDTTHFLVVQASLLSWPKLQVVCAPEDLGSLQPEKIDTALLRVASHFPAGPARNALEAPLAKHYLAEISAQSPPARRVCIRQVLGQVRDDSDILAMALRRARAYCPVAYQAWLVAGEEP